MIKINLLVERKPSKAKTAVPGVKLEGMGAAQNFLLVGVLLLGVVAGGAWWWTLNQQQTEWQRKHADADRELERLKEIRAKGEYYKQQREMKARKLELITNLKKQQTVPVRILDQISRNLPEFLWLESVTANDNSVNVGGKATTYTAVSNFYTNLTGAGHFQDVTLGRTFEVPEGVAFSLTFRFAHGGGAPPAGEPQG